MWLGYLSLKESEWLESAIRVAREDVMYCNENRVWKTALLRDRRWVYAGICCHSNESSGTLWVEWNGKQSKYDAKSC